MATFLRYNRHSGRGGFPMPKVAAFFSVNEKLKLPEHRVHHNNSACPPARDMPSSERKPGTNGYRLCNGCARLNLLGM